MLNYSISREWASGFRIDADILRSIDNGIRRIARGNITSSVSLELSNSTSMKGQLLGDVLIEENSPGRLFEVLVLDYRSYDPGASNQAIEYISLTLSRRSSQPSVIVHIETESQERLAVIARDIESRIEGIIIKNSLAVRLLTPPHPNEGSPISHLAMLIPIAFAIWTSLSISNSLRDTAVKFEHSLSQEASTAEIGKTLIEYISARFVATSKQQLVVMLGLALAVVIWLLSSQIIPSNSLALDRHFLIGDYANRYRTSLTFRSRLIWSAGVGLLVSVLGSAIIFFLTK